jgi:hypothetical protein
LGRDRKVTLSDGAVIAERICSRRFQSGRIERKFRDRAGHECGAIPGNMMVVVVDKQPKEKPSFSRLYRPADLYLNGECTDANGYYIEQSNLVAL